MEDRLINSLREAIRRQTQQGSGMPHAASEPAIPASPLPHCPRHAESDASLFGFGAVPTAPSAWSAHAHAWIRPRISLVGALAVSLLMSAGLFALQRVVNPRHARRSDEVGRSFDRRSSLMLSARQTPDESDDGLNAAPAHEARRSLKSRSFHSPAADGPGDELLSESPIAKQSSAGGTAAAERKRDEADPHARQTAQVNSPASTEQVTPLFGDGGSASARQSDALPQQTAIATPAVPGRATDVNLADWNWLPRDTTVTPLFAPQGAAGESTSSHGGSDLAGPLIVPGRRCATIAPAAPANTTNPAAASTGPLTRMSATVEAPSPEALPRPQSLAQPPKTDPGAIPGDVSKPLAATPREPAYGLFQQPVAGAAPRNVSPAAPEASRLESLDRTKVMSFQFRNAPWSVVLAKFAAATGLELRMQAYPDGVFNRFDSRGYTPSQTLAILNAELAGCGCQLKLVDNILWVLPAASNPAAARR